MTTVDELVGPPKAKRPNTNTSFNTPDIQDDGSNIHLLPGWAAKVSLIFQDAFLCYCW